MDAGGTGMAVTLVPDRDGNLDAVGRRESVRLEHVVGL
jgi:hypothetical protein